MRLGKRVMRNRVDAAAEAMRANVATEVNALARTRGLSRQNAARLLLDMPSSTARAQALQNIIDAPPAARGVLNQLSVLRHVTKHLNNADLAMLAATSRAFRSQAANTRRPPCIVTSSQRVTKRERTEPLKTGRNQAGIHARERFVITQIPNTFVSIFPTKKELLERLEMVLTRHRTYPVALYGPNSFPGAKAYLRKLRSVHQGIALLCPETRLLDDIQAWYDLRAQSFAPRALRKRGARTVVEFARTMTYWALYIAMHLAGLLNKTTRHGRGRESMTKARW